MRVVIGLSGGVDSSVAAHLLLEQGHEVIALFMRNWNDESVTINNECPWIHDANDAMLVANYLGFPFRVMVLSTEYKERIVDYMFDEYAAGRTPNPDVLCNRALHPERAPDRGARSSRASAASAANVLAPEAPL